jgi:predicted deacylase
MRKIFLVLLLLAVFVSVGAVSAAENASLPDDVLEVDNVDEIVSQDVSNADVQGVDVSAANSIKSSSAASKKVAQVPSKAKAKNIKSTYGTKAKYSLKLYDKSGKAIAGKNVKFKIGKKVYKIKTDSDGVATLKLNYSAGKYTIKYSVGKLAGKNTYTVRNAVSLSILKWGNKGDLSKLGWIKKHMPNNKWVKESIKAAKKGNPLLKFKGGKGKKVFIISGTHGNELSSQIATMKMIKYLTNHPIKGTVYMIPFVNVKAIAHKVRHTGVDYNRVAHKSGTISNKIVKLVKKYDCDAFGDFHTSQPGGAPGQNIVMGSKTPAKKCAKLTNYIAKHAKVHKRLYKYAGQEYPGALADNVNKKGIPGVICEVVLPHNTVTSSSVKISYRMLNSFLKFNSVI